MTKRNKLISCVLVVVMIVISVMSVGVSAKGNVYTVGTKGATIIQAESCSDHPDGFETYLHQTYVSFNAGNWLDFYLDIEKGGSYLVTTYVGRTPSEKPVNFTVTIDGADPKSSLIPDTTGWMDFGECELFEMEIPEGRHTIRFTITSAGCHFDSFSLRRIEEFSSNTDYAKDRGPYRSLFAPSIIQAEDFDMGETGCVSANRVNDGNQYRKDSLLDIYAIRPNGYYLTLLQGESANYTFNVPERGIYALSLTMGAGDVNVYLDGHPESIKVTSASESGFGEVFAGNILLEEGKHILSLSSETAGISIDSFRFKPAKEGEYYTEKHFETGFAEKTPEPTEEPVVESTPTPTPEPTPTPTPEPDPFTDISGHWAYDNIKKAAKGDILKGYPDGTFKPQNSLTVLDACVLAMRAAKLSFSEAYPQNIIYKYGLITDENLQRSVTREEFARIIVIALSYESGEITGKYKPEVFVDEANIESENLAYVHAARTLSLMTGDENKEFRPKANLTRAEAATILTRVK